jgi:hypothetical protein
MRGLRGLTSLLFFAQIVITLIPLLNSLATDPCAVLTEPGEEAWPQTDRWLGSWFGRYPVGEDALPAACWTLARPPTGYIAPIPCCLPYLAINTKPPRSRGYPLFGI